MIIIAHRARVVFSPLTTSYQVQYKTWRFGEWRVDTTYAYYPDGGTPRGDAIWSHSQAHTKACMRAEALVADSVVHDEKR